MNDSTKYSENSSTAYDDEISITELLQKLWKKRGLIVILPLVCAGLTVAGLLGTKVAGNEHLSYYVELTGIKDAQYPNSVAFSPQDLLNPKVISKISEQFSLKDANKTTKHINIQYGTPTSNGILVEYKSALSANSKAPPEEIARINDLYTERLKSASLRGLSISADYAALGLSKIEGAQLLKTLPQTWNEVFASEFKIFMDTGVLALSSSSNNVRLDTTVGAAEADSSLSAMAEGLEQLRNDARFRAISFEGTTPADAARDLKLFRELYFDPIFTSSFTEAGGLSSVYRRDLQLQVIELQSQLTELDSRIAVILEVQQRSSNKGLASSNNARGDSQIQLESDALGQLVSLSTAASLAEYLQETLNQRLDFVSEQAVISTRLAKMGSVDANLKLDTNSLDANFYSAAFQKFQNLQANYEGLVSQAQASALAETPALYQVMTEVMGEKLLQRRDFLFIALALALGGIVAVISALIWPTRGSQQYRG
ncbi:hypothetical protein [Luminiphilus sp. nBUS_07]|uniref:hypothetical protein n=1 Tax=Luminiphilus sp. nBUS_07 TaxID=3395314 RepID=UPI003EB76486